MEHVQNAETAKNKDFSLILRRFFDGFVLTHC